MTTKIDWKNLAIGFLSALLGILIAFQLEHYQEEHQQKEKLSVTPQSIKQEIKSLSTISIHRYIL